MLTFEFTPADLAKIRLAVSPLLELWQSVRALQNPAARALHPAWITETSAKLQGLDVSLLKTLQDPRRYAPDFIHPPPRGPRIDLEHELELVRSTSHEQVRQEIMFCCTETGVPPELQRFIEEPASALAELVELLRCYWHRVLEPDWDRIRALLDGDVLYRARRAADGGATYVFSDLDPSVTFVDDRLHVDKPWTGVKRLDGRGLLLVPSVFIWPMLAVVNEEPWQPTIIYAARGAAMLWEPPAPAPEALGALIGERRATVLIGLDSPRSTTELATTLQVPPASVSQHLSVLLKAGLIYRHRVGRAVLYERSARGEQLVAGLSNTPATTTRGVSAARSGALRYPGAGK
jgi:DNA-binding transcriptional ArsR family regulator